MGTTHSNSRPSDWLSSMPAEVAHCVASFLLGVELVLLTHASPALLKTFNVRQVWAWRIASDDYQDEQPLQQPPPPAWWCAEKATYLQRRAVLFSGRSPRTWLDRFPALGGNRNEDSAPFPIDTMRDVDRFSIELTFSIPPKKFGSPFCHGGVLLGFQSEPRVSATSPTSFLSLVSIDSTGGLRPVARGTNAPTRVAAKVSFGVWHRLELAFDGRYVRAYLDDELRYFTRIPHGFNWDQLRYGQIGTGFGYDPNRTLASYSDQKTAWRPFHGLVASARVTASSTHLTDGNDGRLRTLYSMSSGDTSNVKRVAASWPCEHSAHTLGM